MKLHHSLTVNAPIERVWEFLMNVPAMASCIPGASDVTQVDDRTYDATVAAKIGPISARFGCRIGIVELDGQSYRSSVELSGKDSKLGGAIKGSMQMVLQEESGTTRVELESDIDVMGRIGQYGHGMLSKRADAMLADFADCAQAKLAGQE